MRRAPHRDTCSRPPTPATQTCRGVHRAATAAGQRRVYSEITTEPPRTCYPELARTACECTGVRPSWLDQGRTAPAGPRVVATSEVRRRRTELVDPSPLDRPVPKGRRLRLRSIEDESLIQRRDMRPARTFPSPVRGEKENASDFHGFRSSAKGELATPVATTLRPAGALPEARWRPKRRAG